MSQITRLSKLPDGVPLQFFNPPHELWVVGISHDMTRYFAIRSATPSFIVEVSDPHLLDLAAGEILNQFLGKMHTFGIRAA